MTEHNWIYFGTDSQRCTRCGKLATELTPQHTQQFAPCERPPMSTYDIILRIAGRIRADHPHDADKLLFVASEVQWLETRINELVSDEIAAQGLAQTAKLNKFNK
jgi:hypothetical protein